MKGNPELETTRHMHMKNCINLQSLGHFLVTLPLPTSQSFLPPYERLYFYGRGCTRANFV